MTDTKAIKAYNKTLDKSSRDICDALFDLIETTISKGEGKVWHGAPVWFINGNPIVGYSKKKAGVELLFWSGQDFEEEKLLATGKFKAAGVIYTDVSDVKKTELKRWLTESKKIQWDYANVVKNRKLVKLTSF